MINKEMIMNAHTRHPSGFHSAGHSLHIHVIPLLMSILFLCALLLLRQQLFSDVPESNTAAAAEGDLPNLSAGNLSVQNRTETADSAEIILDAEVEYQYPELPNGCEATSLSIALAILGYPTDKLTIAYDYLPSEPFTKENGIYYAPDPDVLYAGDPATNLGFYCFEYPITVAANCFFDDHAASWTAKALYTVTGDQIETALYSGSPVIIWSAIDYSHTALYHEDFSWRLSNGETYVPYSNLHCTVVYGFDQENYMICDPIAGQLEIEKDTLLKSVEALDSHGVYFQDFTQ